MRKEFVITRDGSHTIYLPEMDEHYHSTYGAIQESLHIYIGAGFMEVRQPQISILEIGFGTGLNAFLTCIQAIQKNIQVNYFSLEKYPLGEEEYARLNYVEEGYRAHEELFTRLHQAKWGSVSEISPGFCLQKFQADVLQFDFNQVPKVDLLYYDAFAPNKQPELWNEALIGQISACVKPGGIVVTYCAKGAVRRAFASAGFDMERLPGPEGKKEIIRGRKRL